MELTTAEINHIEEKHERNERLSLEEVMMLYYKKPCRRVFPHSNDPVVTELKANRGSVVVMEDEVVVVCNPLDFHLLAPPAGFGFEIVPQSRFLHGTTIVRVSIKGNVTVSFTVRGSNQKERESSLIKDRWGTAMLGGVGDLSIRAFLFTKSSYDIEGGHTRILTCVEEAAILGSFSAKSLLRTFRKE